MCYLLVLQLWCGKRVIHEEGINQGLVVHKGKDFAFFRLGPRARAQGLTKRQPGPNWDPNGVRH